MDEGGEPLTSTDEATVVSGVELVSLKDGQAFLVADHNGDVTGGAEGLFDRDTRVLSRFVFLVGERHPTRLSSTVSRDNAVFTVHSTNRAIPPVNGRGTPRGAMHIERRRTLRGERLLRAGALHQLRPRPGDAAAGVRIRRRLSRHVRGQGRCAGPAAARS
jgi:hypothetical protein